jgi:hypothetical protein
LISSGDGNIDKLIEAAGGYFGHLVGYEVLIKTFLRSEVTNAVSTLRQEGCVETVGRHWKPVLALESDDVEQISMRRFKRLRGELKEEIRLDHAFGRHEEAAMAGKMLEVLSERLESGDVSAESESQDAHAT